MNKKGLFLFLALAMVLFPLLAACDSGDPEIREVTKEVEVEKIVTQVVKETVIVEGTPEVVEQVVTKEVVVTPTSAPAVVTILQGVDPNSLDPQVGESGPKENVMIHMFDSLTAMSDEMAVVPQAAESWEIIDEDNLVWRFHLRDDITYWNGEPLNAHAVKYSLDRGQNEDLRAQGLTEPIYSRADFDRVEVVDDYTVDIHTNSPAPLLPMWMSFFKILEPTYYDSISLEEASINPMGSGAFRFVEWIKDDHILLERNPDWWGGQPEISQIIFRPVPEAAVRLSELETGAADLVVDLKPEDLGRVASMPNARMAPVQGGRRVHVALNTNMEHFQDQRVRQAFNYAVNWDEINQAILGGMAPNRIVSVVSGWVPDDLEAYPYDPEKAIALLEEAGFPMDQKMVLNTPNGRYLKDVELGQAVAAQLGDIGLDVEAIPLEWSVMNEAIRAHNMQDMWLLGFGSRLNGLQDLATVKPDALFNAGDWSNDAFMEAYNEANQYMTKAEQLPGVQEAIRIAKEDAPWIFLYRQIALYGTSNRLANWIPRPDERIRLDRLELE